MRYWAHLDDNNNVINLSVGSEEEADGGLQWLIDNIGGTFVETWTDAYSQDKRYNLAIVGGTYDAENNAFITPQPFASWSLNTETFRWQAPVPYPQDGSQYTWSEANQNWEQI